MTQPKPAAGRDPAPEDSAPAASQPLPFAPPKSSAQQGPREPQPLAPSSAAQPSQPIQFTPARTPAPGPQAPPPAAQPPAPPAAETPITIKRKRSGTGRFVMLVVIPLVALALGFTWWLSSGRYVSTDNAYVGADKSLITPQVTGAIVAVHVAEGQKVKVGDPLFDIDRQPYEIALALARGRLDAAKVEFANLKSSYISNAEQIKMGEGAVAVRQTDFDRKNGLAVHGTGTTADRDTSMGNLIQAKQILEFVRQQQATVTVKLGGGPDASIDNFPDYMQAKAGLEDAERNLRNTKVLAPIDGVATQVPEIQVGRVAAA
ncbi:MAG TPA: biotin/lipoyl-binding protein, partial [Pseudolabrys sp.]